MHNWNDKGTPMRDRQIIFVDFDGLLPELEAKGGTDGNGKMEGDTAQALAILVAEAARWDKGFVYGLQKWTEGNMGLVLISEKFAGLDDGQLDNVFAAAGLDVEDVLEAGSAKGRAEAIVRYLKMSYDSSRYVILDTEDIDVFHRKLRGHVCRLKCGERIGYDMEEKIGRILKYGPWWGYLHDDQIYPNAYGMELVDEEIEKVIFLDIDGVLNDDGPQVREQPVTPEFVANLAKIVKATGAQIILSSSWRGAVKSFLNYGGKYDDVELLFSLMDENGIHISGCTPELMSGPDGRPYEIRSWLAHRPNVKRFVILDDETFWTWGWLGQFVVCTRESSGDWHVPDVCGLGGKYVEQAVKLLTNGIC